MSKSFTKNKVLTLIGALLILFAVFMIVFLLIINNGNETRLSDGEENDEVVALVCQSSGREDGFFESEKANTVVNEIKATFDDDGFNKLYFSYEGVYRSTEVAGEDETKFHSSYNKYMGENSLEQMSLSPSYSVTKNKFHLTLIADEKDDFNKVTAKFFFVDDESIEKFKKFSMSEMKSYYESKGFNCSQTK